MKKRIIIFMLFALSFSLAGSAWGAVGTPPKSLCLSMTWSNKSICMGLKNQGTIKFKAGPAKFYSIHGEILTSEECFPITGTAYVKGEVLNFNLSGSYPYSNIYASFHLDGTWNLVDKTGYCNWSINDEWGPGPEPLLLTDCALLDLPNY